MAEIRWLKRANKALDERIAYASAEFGRSTVRRWLKEIGHAETRIASMSMPFTPEPLLAGKKHEYRYCHLMNRRFKLIYCYYPTSDTIRIVDIWDTRMSPEALRRRVK